MNYFIIFAVCVAVAAAKSYPVLQDEDAENYPIFEDQNGQEYLAIPINRLRRDVTWGANQGGYSVGHSGTPYNNGDHRVDTSVGASKAWGSNGLKPDTFGGRVDYSHSSGSGAFVGANRTPGYGTDVSAGGKVNIAGGKNWNADVSGSYDRHFGGPGGTGKPQVGAGLNVNGRF